MVKRMLFVLVAFLMLPALAAQAGDYHHEKTGISITIPDSWEVEAEEDMLSANTKDETVGLVFVAVPGEALAEAIEEMEKALTSTITGFEQKGEPDEVEINGMKGITVDGAGKIEGEAVEVGAMLLAAPKDNMFILVIGIAKEGAVEKHAKDVESIFTGLKPTKSKTR